MNQNRRTMALIGAALLILGFFMPLVSFLGLLNFSYFDLIKLSSRFVTGVIILALGGVSLALALKNSYAPLLATGVAALAVLAFDFFTYKSALAKMAPGGSGGIATGTGSGPEQLGQIFLERAAGIVLQPSWGMFLLAGGAVLLIIAGAMKGAPQAGRDWRDAPPPPMNYR